MLWSLLPGHEAVADPPGLCIDRDVAPDGSTFEVWALGARPVDVTVTGLEAILDLLDHGCDGEPRWITVQPGDPDHAGALRHVIAREARLCAGRGRRVPPLARVGRGYAARSRAGAHRGW